MVAVIGKRLMFQGTLASQELFTQKEGWTVNINLTMNIHANHRRTLEHTRNTPGCIFPCFGQEIKQKCILGAPMPFLVPLHTHPDIIGMKTTPPNGRAHTHLHSIQVWSQWNWQFLSYSYFCTLPPVFPDLTIIWPSETWPQNQPHNNSSLSLPRPQLMPLLACWLPEPHPSACPPMTGTRKMHTTLSLYFGIPWRIGSSSTTSHLTVRITTDTFLQPWEQIPGDACPVDTNQQRRGTESDQSKSFCLPWQNTSGNDTWCQTHVCLRELEDVVARMGEDPQDLITGIKTLMDHCKMINDKHHKHELHCYIICAYCQEGKLLGKPIAKPSRHLLASWLTLLWTTLPFSMPENKSPTAPNL